MKDRVSLSILFLTATLTAGCGQADFFGDTDKIFGRDQPPQPQQQPEPGESDEVTATVTPKQQPVDDGDGDDPTPPETCSTDTTHQVAPVQSQKPLPGCNSQTKGGERQ